jgi:hypothetical protein
MFSSIKKSGYPTHHILLCYHRLDNFEGQSGALIAALDCALALASYDDSGDAAPSSKFIFRMLCINILNVDRLMNDGTFFVKCALYQHSCQNYSILAIF